MSKYSIPRDRVHRLHEEHQRLLETIVPLVVICGPQKCDSERSCDDCEPPEKTQCMYNLRNRINQKLNDENCLATTFEEDFELNIASIEEQIILKNDEVDIVIVISDSKGSAAELAIFAKDPIIRRKLRVFVPYQYHPLYSDSESFLTSLYLELMSVFGHIYPIDPTGKHHPTGITIATILMRAFRLYKLSILIANNGENPHE